MQTLWKIRSLVNSDKILIVRHKLAEAIIYQNTHMPFNSNDWMLMIRGLNYKYNVEKEAIRVLADCLNTKKNRPIRMYQPSITEYTRCILLS
ncbi:MAG: hypothetical protein QS748_06255 [Candidatus Endonucleobacter bathymodioli]|uniref:Uncharacterized protein n=1 Tax=Candidatus Endonucleibacter bathymodioli TaxID=539814 RepID=A0AA90NLF0_9GAMM|nr:hypothetical protein [Candidatus Endonucleobacter bathymodioli]